MTVKLNCPTCQREIEWTEAFPFRPFCSDRCKLIDLGEWASEQHKIKGPTLPIDPNLMDSDEFYFED